MNHVPDGGWHAARILMAVTAIAALALSVAIPINASLTDSASFYATVETETGTPKEQPADSEESKPTIGPNNDTNLRELPLLPSDSIVREQFKTLSDTQDYKRVDDIARILAGRAGIDEDLYYSLESNLPNVKYAERDVYPYRLPELEALLSDALAEEAIATHAEELLEFASFSTLRAAWTSDDPEMSQRDQHAWLSYTILQALPDSCDQALSVAHLATLGQTRILATTETSIRRAITFCADDPTANYVYGMWLADRTVDFENIFWQPSWDSAITFFQDWQKSNPDSSLAHAGAAHAMLRLIVAADASGAMPLTVRELRAKALVNISRAIKLDPQPEHYAASAVISEMMGDSPTADQSLRFAKDIPQAGFARSYLHHHRKEFSKVEAITPSLLHINPVQLSALGSWVSALTPGSPMSLSVEIEDPGLHDIGAGEFDWFGTIPEFRGSYTQFYTCPVAWRKWNALLAGDYEEAAQGSPISEEILRISRCTDWQGSVVKPLEEMAKEAARNTPTSYYYDEWQNYLRLAHDFDGAETVVEKWITDLPGSSLALSRRGELRFLRGNFDDAASDFRKVSDSLTADGRGDAENLCRYESVLALGLALGESETQGDDALAAFIMAREMPDEEKNCVWLTGVDAYISSRMAAERASAGDQSNAIQYFEEALQLFKQDATEN